MPVRGGIHRRWPAPFRAYVRGLATSITTNVPAYGYSIVVSTVLLVVVAEHHAPRVIDAFLTPFGATVTYVLVLAAELGLAATIRE